MTYYQIHGIVIYLYCAMLIVLENSTSTVTYPNKYTHIMVALKIMDVTYETKTRILLSYVMPILVSIG